MSAAGPRHPLLRRSKEWAALQKPLEFSALLWKVEELRPRSVLEIGTRFGGTLYCWCQLAAPDAEIVSVDLPPDVGLGHGYSPERADEMRRLFPQNGQRLHLIQADSQAVDTLRAVRKLIDRLDFLYIDGDHRYEGVRRDFELYGPLVRKGGLVAFHDINPTRADSEVDRFWAEIREAYEHEELVSPPENWGGIGLIRA